MIPTLLDSNVFIALDHKFSLSEALQCAREVLVEAKRLGFDPIILSCVLEEIHRSQMKSAILTVSKVVRINDDDGKMVMAKTRSVLTRVGKLTDYKLIAAGMSMSKDRPLLVSDDYNLRCEYARMVSTGDVMTPYQFTDTLNQMSSSVIMNMVTNRLLNHFMEHQEPEAFKSRRQELRQQVAAQKDKAVKRAGESALVASYLAGKKLTKSEKKIISSLRPILERVRNISSSADILSEIETLRAQVCATAKTGSLDALSPAFRQLAHLLVEKGQEAQEAGGPDIALRYMDEASTLLAFSSEGLGGLYLKLNGMRALAYLLKQDIEQALRILRSLIPLIHGEDVKDQTMVWCTLGVVMIITGEEDQATQCFAKVPQGVDLYQTVREFGNLFYRHRLYREALSLYRFLILKDIVDEEMIEPLYRSAGILGEGLDETITKKIVPELRKDDHTKKPMPYLTRDYGKEWTMLEDPETPRYFRDPMKVCAMHNTPKGTLLVCWNDGLSSRIGVNLPHHLRVREDIDSIRLNSGPAKMKTTMYGPLYNIRGEIDTTKETDMELIHRPTG